MTANIPLSLSLSHTDTDTDTDSRNFHNLSTINLGSGYHEQYEVYWRLGDKTGVVEGHNCRKKDIGSSVNQTSGKNVKPYTIALQLSGSHPIKITQLWNVRSQCTLVRKTVCIVSKKYVEYLVIFTMHYMAVKYLS